MLCLSHMLHTGCSRWTTTSCIPLRACTLMNTTNGFKKAAIVYYTKQDPRNKKNPSIEMSIFPSCLPSTSFTVFPKDIYPFPKTSEPRYTTKRTSVGTISLTSTPYKDQLQRRETKQGSSEREYKFKTIK